MSAAGEPDATIPLSRPQHPAPPGGMANPDAKVDYLFGAEIARGGMGSILQAEDCKLPRTVAVKIILSEIDADDDQKQRFINEAAVLAKLAHPNIVPVYDIGRDADGQLYYSMKLVKGRTLKAILNDLRGSEESGEGILPSPPSDAGGRMPRPHYTLERLLTVFRKVCDAMAFAHSKGIIHRDLKPENIMVGEFGEVLVMDWGLAKSLDAGAAGSDGILPSPMAGSPRSLKAANGASLSRTLDGSVMGTPQYMSPEQAEGRIADMDARSDIFSLGGILYTILTLRPPVEGKTLDEMLQNVISGKITPLEKKVERASSPHANAESASSRHPSIRGAGCEAAKRTPPHFLIPPALAAVTMKALSLKREDRYQTVAAFSADIEAYQNGFATSAENAGLAKQLVLLIKRHKGMFGTAAAAWFIIAALAVWFVFNITRERNRATANEQIAQTNEKRAVASEQEAVAEKENVRRALAKSALALAEAAYREADGPAMQSALDQVPADLRDANWSYLLDQSDTSIARASAGHGVIRSAAAHPKMPGVFAVADDSTKVTILEARTGVRLLQFEVDLGKVGGTAGFHLAFSPDGERIAVGKSSSEKVAGGGIAIHSARDGTKLLTWESDGVTKLEFSPDGRRLLYLAAGKQLNLWDAASGKKLWSNAPEGTLIRCAITPDGQHVLSAIGNNKLVLLKIEDGTESRVLVGKARSFESIAIQPDGGATVWGDGFGFVHGFDLRNGRLLFSNRAHASRIKHVAFTSDGTRFVSVAELPDGRQFIQLSDAKTGVPLQSLIGGSGNAVEIAVHPLSGELLTCGTSPRLWDTSGTPARWLFRTPATGGIYRSGIFPGSDDLFLGPATGHAVSLQDLRGPSIVWSPASGNFRLATASVDGRVIVCGGTDGAGPVLALRRLDEKVEEIGAYSTGGAITALRLNASGDRLALARRNKGRQRSVLDPATGKELAALESKSVSALRDLQWIGGDRQLLGAATVNKPRGQTNSEERIIVWDAATGQQTRSVAHPTALDCLVVAPDGKSFAAAGADKLVHIFETGTLKERESFRAHDGPITALAWHPSRPIVATGSEDLTIKLWNIESGRRLETLRGPTAAPHVLNFSPSGQRLACAAADRTVRIWEPKALNNAVLDAPATDGWEDLLGKLKAEEVKAKGNGWTLSGGVLINPNKRFATMPLGGSYMRSSYQVRMTVRSLGQESFIAAILPVADQQTCFIVDGAREKGYVTGLWTIDRKPAEDTPGVVRGQQIKDSEPHDLEITVRLSARTAQITATLDDRPLYDWSGPVTSLGLATQWPSLPQPTLHLGANAANWIVSAVKVKRL